jgi:hypothetical protein
MGDWPVVESTNLRFFFPDGTVFDSAWLACNGRREALDTLSETPAVAIAKKAQ